MPRPLKRRELLRILREHGFDGPYPGARHEFMVKGALKLWIPNPHGADLSGPLVAKIFKQAGISPKDW